MLPLRALCRRTAARARRRAIVRWFALRLELVVCLFLGAVCADSAVAFADLGAWRACAGWVGLLLAQVYFAFRAAWLLESWPARVSL